MYKKYNSCSKTRIIETRIMIRKSDGWIFADYIWMPSKQKLSVYPEVLPK
jgi:hypothetical protein